VALALRSVFEPVMVAYYLWPPLALALITTARGWPRLAATALMAAVITFVSQATWHSPWTWWVPMLAALALALALARPEIDWQRERSRLALARHIRRGRRW
jgi:FtsH-binding integral membrane protein